jgi:signal transduction histidine kinase/CHASE2 domain-containing sensor protein
MKRLSRAAAVPGGRPAGTWLSIPLLRQRGGDAQWRREVQSRPTWGMTIGLAAALFVLLLLKHHPVGQRFEFDSLDVWFNLREGTTSNRVALAAIDEETIRAWNGRTFDGAGVALLLRRLEQASVASTTLALPALCGPGRQSGAAVAPADVPALATTLGASTSGASRSTVGAVVLPLLARPRPGTTSPALEDAALAARWSEAMPHELSEQMFPPVRSLEAPPRAWLGGAVGAGHTAFGLDVDGRPRLAWPALAWRGRLFPSLAVAAAARERRAHRRFDIESWGQPLLLDFTPLDVVQQPLPTVESLQSSETPIGAPAAQLTVDASASAPGFPRISVARLLSDPGAAQVLAGRHVIVCVTAHDMAASYFAPDGRRVLEGELHAVALDNLLSGASLTEAPEILLWVLSILCCVIVGGFVAARPTVWSAVVTLLCMLTIFILSAGLFVQNVWLDITPPWLGIGLTYLTAVIGRARRDTREATRYASTVDVLARYGGLLTARNSANELPERILDWCASALDVQGGSILMLDDEGERLRFAASLGPGASKLQHFALRVGEGVAGWAAQHGQSVFLTDARVDKRFNVDMDRAAGLETRSLACVPLKAGGKVLGVLQLSNRRGEQSWSRADVEVLEAIAAQSALALDNARLNEILNRRVQYSEESLEDANRRLESEKNLLNTVLQSMTDGVIVIGEDEEVRMVNRAATRLLPEFKDSEGRALGQVLGEYPDEFHRLPDDRRGGRSALFTRGDVDAPRFIEARSSPLPFRANSSGGRGEVIVFADVTEEKYIEQAKSDFVSFVAHEMRSPLTTISGFSSMLNRTEAAAAEPNAQRLRFLGLIFDESERLKRLINSLLDVARIEAGLSVEISMDEWEWPPVANRAIESQRAYSSRHRIEARWEENLPPVRGDRDKATQVLINLLSNAMKYSPGGTVTVEARVKRNWASSTCASACATKGRASRRSSSAACSSGSGA